MSGLILGCPYCAKALEVSPWCKPNNPFSCLWCGGKVYLTANKSSLAAIEQKVARLKKFSREDLMLQMLIDAAGYGAFYAELSERESGMSVARQVQEGVKDSSTVKEQMKAWLKDAADAGIF